MSVPRNFLFLSTHCSDVSMALHCTSSWLYIDDILFRVCSLLHHNDGREGTSQSQNVGRPSATGPGGGARWPQDPESEDSSEGGGECWTPEWQRIF